jgi:hypothetical protein
LKGRNPNGPKAHEKMLTIPGHKGNANKNHTKILLHPVRVAIIKNTPPTNVGEEVEKKEPSSKTMLQNNTETS